MKDIDFTRDRKLNFITMMNIMIKKSSKSLQNTLNESKAKIHELCNSDYETVTNGAYTRARAKLKYEAFIELSELVKDGFYEDGDYQTYKGFRLLAVDGSIVTLPNTDNVKTEFTPTVVKNQVPEFSKDVVLARVSTLYDVLNSIVIDASINDKSIGERRLAKEHLEKTDKNDLTIYDRGYPSYELFAEIDKKSNYLMRIRKNSFSKVKFLFDKHSKIKDVVLEIKAPKKIKEELQKNNLPLIMKVRFVQVLLSTGEVEVLATNILNANILQTEDFKELYALRWGIETFYHIIKNRLLLENFTGYTALSVKQDFHITMFLSNYESLLAYDVNQELQEKTKDNMYKQKVNKSISFNTVKQKSFELFYSNKHIDLILENMQILFMTNTVIVRPNKMNKKRLNKEKDKSTIYVNSANFYKRKKKAIA